MTCSQVQLDQSGVQFLVSTVALRRAVVACLKLSPEGDCPFGEWDVSGVTDMGKIFDGAIAFNGDISKWEVISAASMIAMFAGAICSTVTSLGGTGQG